MQSSVDLIKTQLYEQLLGSINQEFGTGEEGFTQYQDDPVGFIRNEMGITLTDDIAQMVESVRDNRITVARSATGTGKSHGASAVSTWFYKCFPNSRVYTTANPYENQKILWGELSAMSENSKLFSGDKITTMHIERSAKDFITSLTVPTTGTDEVKEGKFSGKHHEHMLFVVDEGDTVPDFAYRGIEGCMSGGHVRLLILFNPRYEAGEPYRLERNHTANIIHLSAFNHPNVTTGEDIIPGAVDRETTVQRINDWCRPLAEEEKQSINTFELPKFLEGAIARKKGTNETYPPLKPGHYFVNESAFFYMVLGKYSPQPEQQLISREWIDNARTRWDVYVAQHGEIPPVGVKPIIGGDIAEQGRDYNTRCARYGGFIARIKKWNGMDPDLTADIFATEYHELGASASYVDATGIGAGVAPKMHRKGCVAIGVKVAERPTHKCELGEFTQLRDQLYWTYREWLRTDPGAMIPPDERLIQQSLTPTYNVTNGKVKIMPKNRTEGKVCMRDLLKCSPDELDCVVMTFANKMGNFFDNCAFRDEPEGYREYRINPPKLKNQDEDSEGRSKNDMGNFFDNCDFRDEPEGMREITDDQEKKGNQRV